MVAYTIAHYRQVIYRTWTETQSPAGLLATRMKQLHHNSPTAAVPQTPSRRKRQAFNATHPHPAISADIYSRLPSKHHSYGGCKVKVVVALVTYHPLLLRQLSPTDTHQPRFRGHLPKEKRQRLKKNKEPHLRRNPQSVWKSSDLRLRAV